MNQSDIRRRLIMEYMFKEDPIRHYFRILESTYKNCHFLEGYTLMERFGEYNVNGHKYTSSNDQRYMRVYNNDRFTAMRFKDNCTRIDCIGSSLYIPGGELSDKIMIAGSENGDAMIKVIFAYNFIHSRNKLDQEDVFITNSKLREEYYAQN